LVRPSSAAILRGEVFGTMDERIDLVLDAGHISGTGVTTIDVTAYWRIIREGAIPER
jgi:tRNA A37 threonylcarbamoyladenosine synthetase subunit TsaC/SUA5/YrdC